jgi:thiamine-monophosphate kinase
MVSVTALGDLSGLSPVRRSGAAPGDVVALCGTLGHSAAGYVLLSAGAQGPAEDAGLAGLKAAHLRPAPPYDAGPEAARLGASAMIDVSDGLLADLGHVAAASGVTIDISSAAVVPPAGHPLWRASLSSVTDSGDSPAPQLLNWVLTGGEDHSLAATFPPSAASGLPPRWRIIGTVGGAVPPGSAGSGERPCG